MSHVAYEYVALVRGADTVRDQKAATRVRRFDLEATLTHARNLVDFFWTPSGKRQPHRNGVYAIHYLPASVEWKAIRTSLPRFPSEKYEAMSAQLAHVSTSRSKRNAADFEAEIERIASDLKAVWTRWREELDSSSASQIDQAVADWLAAP